MTTAFGISKGFWAVDSRWTFKGTETADDNYPIKKYVVVDNEIYMYAGDENPIIAEQAILLELISEEDYVRLMAHLTDESLETLTVSAMDGAIIDHDGHLYRKRNAFYIGSGGMHACDFFYWSEKKKYISNTGCNVLGSMLYASHKDKASGGEYNVKIWKNFSTYSRVREPEGFDIDITAYHTLIKSRVIKMINTLDRAEGNSQLCASSSDSPISSQYCSTGTTELTKVSLASAISRLQRRAKRKQEKASANTK